MKAFPNHRSEGMDLRDYFAAAAMQELINCFVDDSTIENADDRRNTVAIAAYKQADAMMKAREGK
jgi:hypothetical protein